MARYQYKRERSGLWITIYHNEDDSYSISTGQKYVELLNSFFPMFEINSPTKWKESTMYEGVYTIWLPCGCYIDNDIDKFREWCGAATTEVLWLELNRNIDAYFFDELDFCIACDFNIIYGQGRTEIGEAEYQLKYNVHNLDYKSKTCYENIIIDKMLKSCKYIPMYEINGWCLSPLPASSNGKNKLAWNLSLELSRQLGVRFVDSTLLCDKPQMKQLLLEDKIKVWHDIYKNGKVEIECDVYNKDVLVVDDLYQSGATMWEYAKYLKSLGAKSVWGLVCVKSLKDSDNK